MLHAPARRFLLGLAATLGLTGAAQAIQTPTLVVDADSGKVIYQRAATDPWYPASITKLMTTYVALDLVRQGRASLDTMITISPAAAAEAPSKMGFRAGTQLTLDNALKIIMVKSANDVSHAIGESLGGSIEGFAEMMNQASARLGMRESRWFNPHGLPDPRQWTSARDMAILGRALMRDFPERHDLFSISAIQFGTAVMANHNGLLGRYAGADGMKTGFICSGGFNVVASATRGGRRIITVVMGQPSARERDLKAADLFDYGFTQSAGWTSDSVEALAPSAVAEPPDMRPYVCQRSKPMPIDEGPGAIAAPAPGTGDQTHAQLAGATGASSALALATLNNGQLRTRSLPPRAPLQPIAVWIGRSPAEGQAILAQQAEAAKAEQAAARNARAEALKAKREASRQAKLDAKAKADARKAEAKASVPAPKTKAAALPKNAAAYTAAEGGNPGIPQAGIGKPLPKGKPAAKAAEPKKPAPKAAAAAKPTTARSASARKPAAADE